ncbi:hypothetical protein U9M48_032774 [Paspalum notatum var. saurae]|uniref:Serpin domain-containing protein n=1 Tax=Paspalum notatum var. saurae TaxID=547442 RepID=A0AAQ3X5U5_PASNO
MVERAFSDDGGLWQPGSSSDTRVVHTCVVLHDSTGMLKPAYRNVDAVSCKAVVRAMNFIKKPEAARDKFNSWVKAVTNNVIDSILPGGSVTEHTRLVVAMTGICATRFNKDMAKKHKFQRLECSTVDT